MGTESRGRYLIFALRIRKLTDALIALVEEGRIAPDLDERLKEVLASLENAGQPTSVQSLRQRGSFGHYENVVTIDEVVKAQDKAALIQKLQTVIRSNTEEDRQNSALEAIGFFDALESRALYHYTHPSPTQRLVASK
jgi:hypothetical protein